MFHSGLGQLGLCTVQKVLCLSQKALALCREALSELKRCALGVLSGMVHALLKAQKKLGRIVAHIPVPSIGLRAH
ncbi:hypothetical protein GLS_c02350 [Gluconobacter oxydans DSM 3504]|uniref:Uncharacterized protein n=1 Tax=Gluconobacter oxydans DSM 3504 TaxID=1288313 RepID=A0A067Z1D6_GLUOY|nr:hypothetical protein GLS_c02350 [Gluconobacter oxydans DSM 3504]